MRTSINLLTLARFPAFYCRLPFPLLPSCLPLLSCTPALSSTDTQENSLRGRKGRRTSRSLRRAAEFVIPRSQRPSLDGGRILCIIVEYLFVPEICCGVWKLGCCYFGATFWSVLCERYKVEF